MSPGSPRLDGTGQQLPAKTRQPDGPGLPQADAVLPHAQHERGPGRTTTASSTGSGRATRSMTGYQWRFRNWTMNFSASDRSSVKFSRQSGRLLRHQCVRQHLQPELHRPGGYHGAPVRAESHPHLQPDHAAERLLRLHAPVHRSARRGDELRRGPDFAAGPAGLHARVPGFKTSPAMVHPNSTPPPWA